MSFDTILVANRGEIARRIMRTARAMGFGTVAVCSEADRRAAFVREADQAIVIGPAPSAQSYLRIDRIIDAALRSGAGAIHPGYGFLSENERFARACGDAGIVFIGPTPEAIAAMGSKIAAKRLMASHGVPVVPGFDGGDQSDAAFMAAAPAIGFPLLVKASAGGGGKGMRIVKHIDDLPAALATARREAQAAFGDPALLVERYVEGPRHVEVQILGDAHGNVVHCFERECSVQRRHQKILEEAPSPGLDPARRAALGDAAVRAGRAIGYRSAGTVEFVMGADGQFYFLEVNTRLQVEHPVTEMVTGLDLVRLQIEVALGRPLPFRQEDLRITGHAIEARLYAEDADHDFLPQTGTLHDFHVPADSAAEGIRLDSGVEPGDEVGIHYDPMLAKLVAFGATREEANRRLGRALREASVLGVTTNIPFLRAVVAHPAWRAGALSTHFIADHREALAGRHLDPVLAARLATVAAATRTDERRTILPDLPLGWRNNRFVDPAESWTTKEPGPSGATHTIVVRHRSLGAGRFVTRVGDADGGEGAVEVAVLGNDGTAWRFEVAGRMLHARIVDLGDRVFVHADGAELRLERVPRFQSSVAARDRGSCKAPMPGKITAVRVEVGAAVEAGQPLVVLEAMKMEHTLEAPAAGTVEEILVGVGEVVQADAELVRLGPA